MHLIGAHIIQPQSWCCASSLSAAIYILLGTSRLNQVDAERRLRQVLNDIADNPPQPPPGTAVLETRRRPPTLDSSLKVHLGVCG